jgi:hypothetical protein
MLDDTDFNNLKQIYLINYSLNNDYKFYLYNDVEQITVQKYGSLENLESILKKKHERRQQLKDKKKSIKLERETILKKMFEENKIEFQNIGDSYLYINYGKPDPEIILQNEINKTYKKSIRRLELGLALEQKNILIDETYKPCYEYINGLNDDLDETVQKMVIKTLKNKTNKSNHNITLGFD